MEKIEIITRISVLIITISITSTGCMAEYGVDYGCQGGGCYAVDGSSDYGLHDGSFENIDRGGSDCTDSYCQGVCSSLGLSGGICGPYGNCLCDDNPSVPEECGDGIDNNSNGKVDEGCGCSPEGSTKPCYSGPPETRGKGACKDGIQVCTGEMEFFTWGDCEGDVVPQDEVCDGIDNDCDGVVDDGAGASTTEINCEDGIDNDCDGKTDCEDEECPSCCVPVAEICDNGVDDDCDGLVDCSDPNCQNRPEDCTNLKDDNCNGLTDCNDPQCSSLEICNPCAHGGCECCVPGTFRYCDTPTYCSWGRQQCQPDGRWGYCGEATPPAGCGGYAYDPGCCISVGACCQDFWDTNGNGNWNESVGNCTGIADTCST